MKEKQKEKLEDLCARQREAFEELSCISMEMLVQMGVDSTFVLKMMDKEDVVTKVAEKALSRLHDEIEGIFKNDDVCRQAAFDVVLISMVRQWVDHRMDTVKEAIEERDKELNKEIREIKKRLRIKD